MGKLSDHASTAHAPLVPLGLESRVTCQGRGDQRQIPKPVRIQNVLQNEERGQAHHLQVEYFVSRLRSNPRDLGDSRPFVPNADLLLARELVEILLRSPGRVVHRASATARQLQSREDALLG